MGCPPVGQESACYIVSKFQNAYQKAGYIYEFDPFDNKLDFE